MEPEGQVGEGMEAEEATEQSRGGMWCGHLPALAAPARALPAASAASAHSQPRLCVAAHAPSLGLAHSMSLVGSCLSDRTHQWPWPQ